MEFLSAEQAETDIKNFTTQVHALKSASANIGADEVSAEAALLEASARGGDMASVRERTGRFRESLSGVLRNIGETLAGGADARNGHDADASALDGTMLSRLREALRARDIRTIDELLGGLTDSLASGDLASALSRAADCVLVSDFDEAVKIIDDLPDIRGNADSPGGA
jgi:HPt (histidine-containing phosphotransfer) domain-containing protein